MLTVEIDFEPGSRFAVHGQAGRHPVHDTILKRYRHLNFFRHECILQVRTPRVKLPDSAVRLTEPPFGRPPVTNEPPAVRTESPRPSGPHRTHPGDRGLPRRALRSPVIRWHLVGLLLSIIVGTVTQSPFLRDHGQLLPLGMLVLAGFFSYGGLAMVAAIPILLVLAAWYGLASRRVPVLEEHGIVRWVSLLAVASLLPVLLWHVDVSTIRMFSSANPVAPWTWRVPGTTFELDSMWVYYGPPTIGWILLPRLLDPRLRGSLIRKTPATGNVNG